MNVTRLHRNRGFERHFLAEAVGTDIDDRVYIDDVVARLDLGDRLYGNRSFGWSLERLLREIREETLDVGAWSLVTRQAPALTSLHVPAGEAIRLALHHATVYGSFQERVIRHAQGLAIEAMKDAA